MWHQFLQDMDIKKEYALIFIPSGSFSLIIDSVDVKLSLKKIFHHLRPSGIFVFEVETLQSLMQVGVWHGAMRRRSDDSMLVASSLPLMPIDNVGSSVVRYDLIDKGIILKTEVEYYQVRFYTVADMTNLLRKTGFKAIRSLRSYDLQAAPFDQDESIVFECTK